MNPPAFIMSQLLENIKREIYEAENSSRSREYQVIALNPDDITAYQSSFSDLSTTSDAFGNTKPITVNRVSENVYKMRWANPHSFKGVVKFLKPFHLRPLHEKEIFEFLLKELETKELNKEKLEIQTIKHYSSYPPFAEYFVQGGLLDANDNQQKVSFHMTEENASFPKLKSLKDPNELLLRNLKGKGPEKHIEEHKKPSNEPGLQKTKAEVWKDRIELMFRKWSSLICESKIRLWEAKDRIPYKVGLEDCLLQYSDQLHAIERDAFPGLTLTDQEAERGRYLKWHEVEKCQSITFLADCKYPLGF